MIKTVTITNNRNESLLMDLRNPYDTGFAITSITGINPAEANINTTELSIVDGSVFNSARIPNRNIVLNIKLLHKSTIAETRHRLYRYFPIKKKVRLTFDTDTRHAYIDGYVERNEINIFDEFESSQISIICPDPFFKNSEDHSVNMSSFDSVFTFPFSNPVGERTLIISNLSLDHEKAVYYEGDEASGVEFEIRVFDPTSDISLYNSIEGQSMVISDTVINSLTGNTIQAGDIIRISTKSGQKYATLTRDATTYNILASFGLAPNWITINPGDNIFIITMSNPSARIDAHLGYDILYEGI